MPARTGRHCCPGAASQPSQLCDAPAQAGRSRPGAPLQDRLPGEGAEKLKRDSRGLPVLPGPSFLTGSSQTAPESGLWTSRQTSLGWVPSPLPLRKAALRTPAQPPAPARAPAPRSEAFRDVPVSVPSPVPVFRQLGAIPLTVCAHSLPGSSLGTGTSRLLETSLRN